MIRQEVDLHIHSSCSDGSDPVPALVEKLRRAGIRIFSLTDHDTVLGLGEARALVPEDMVFLPGAEFSCAAGAIKCHILGYGFDPSDEGLLDMIRSASGLRRKKLRLRLDRLREEHRIEFGRKELDWLFRQPSAGRPHLAELLIRRGLVSSPREAFDRFLDGMPSPRIDAGTAIRAILAAGGIPVWAHPFGETAKDFLTEEEVLDRLPVLEALGIRGLECYYSQYGGARSRFLLETARARGLLISGGSDYHGTRKEIDLGDLGRDAPKLDPLEDLTVLRAAGIR